MKKVLASILFTLLLSGILSTLSAQPIVNFTLPDSSCVGAQINITNLTTGGSTFFWTFCSGNVSTPPLGTNIGNPGNSLHSPTYLTLVQDSAECFSFITNQGNPTHITRYYHGGNFRNVPISWSNLLQTGVISWAAEGIQIKKDNGNWYGFINNNTSILRFDFGPSIWNNNPTVTDLGITMPISVAHGLIIVQQGTTWLGFFDSSVQNSLYRLNFGNSLTNSPTLEDLGNIATFSQPCQITIQQENGIWYFLITNFISSTISRIDFGTSLLNTPTGTNLGNLGAVQSPVGITYLDDCETSAGYFTIYLSPGSLGKLNFTGGIGGSVTAQNLGDIGNLDYPHSFSEIFRQNDSLFAYITNWNTSSLTQLSFIPCTNATPATSSVFSPPPVSYNQSGTYNVRLLVDDGLPDQVSLCKSIVISPVPTVNLGPDRVICPGHSTTLDAGPGFTTYLWSTNATTRTITVSTAGTYSVTVTHSGCSASDAVNVSLSSSPVVNLGPDTTVCQGQSVTFNAGACTGCTYLWFDLTTGLPVGTSQTYTTTLAGTYKATVTNPNGCQGMDTVQLSTTPLPIVTNSPLSESICSGDQTNIHLTSSILNTTFSWTASGSSGFVSGYSSGTGNFINQTLTNSNTVNEFVTYLITPTAGNCTGIPASYVVTVRPLNPVSVSISASNNNICAGTHVTFTATPVNGGINPSYQWKVNGANAGSGLSTYSYAPQNGDIVACILTSSNILCVSNNPALSNLITMVVIPLNVVSVSISPSSNSVCAGDSVTFTAVPQHGGSLPSYQWQVNGVNTGQNKHLFTYLPANNDQVDCILNSSDTVCITNNPDTSSIYTISVGSNLHVSVTISPGTDTICAGTSVTFTASPHNGGTLPTYQWTVNGLNAGINSTLFTYTPSNNDAISCSLLSNLACTSGNPATSNTASITVNPNLPVSVTISASSYVVCAGTQVTFSATAVNKGTSPSYQWMVNGLNTGTNSSLLTFTPSNNDVVSCIFTSSLTCTSGNPATSNNVIMTVNPNLPVGISISASAMSVCSGSQVFFTATSVYGGTMPTFQWKVNGINAGTNDSTFSYIPLSGDHISCLLQSGETCTAGNPATSNTLVMTVNNNLPVSITIAANDNPVCAGASVSFTASPHNGGTLPTYQWTINAINAGTNSNLLTYVPSDNDVISCTMLSNLICVTGNPATSNIVIMTINSNPVVTFTPCFDTITTINAKPIKLRGGIPLDGTYSGPGVNSSTSIFTPSVAGTGTKTITYSYTNNASCSASNTLHIIVQATLGFTCGNPLIDIRDNKVYPTLLIGSQCWLATNLNYGTILVSSQDQRDNCIAEKYCYGDNPINCNNLGGLYQWNELMQYDDTPADQGFCPPGWHIPTENDWNTLFVNWTNNGFAGSPLKYSGYSGFNALLAGSRYINSNWDFQGFATFLWSSTTFNSTKTWAHAMNDVDPSVAAYPASRVNAFSVRCIKD